MEKATVLGLLILASCSGAEAAPVKKKPGKLVAAPGCPVGTWDFENGSLEGATLEPLSAYHNVAVVQPLKVAAAPSGTSALNATVRVGPGQGGSRFSTFRVLLPLCPPGQKADAHRKKFSARFMVNSDRPPAADEGVEINVWPHIPPVKRVPFGQWVTVSGEMATPTIPASLYAGVERLMLSYLATASTPLTLTIWIDDVQITD